MIKMYSSNRLPRDKKLESTIDVGQTHFNLVNLNFILSLLCKRWWDLKHKEILCSFVVLYNNNKIKIWNVLKRKINADSKDMLLDVKKKNENYLAFAFLY